VLASCWEVELETKFLGAVRAERKRDTLHVLGGLHGHGASWYLVKKIEVSAERAYIGHYNLALVGNVH